MAEINPNFGRSRQHFMAQCFYCSYCDILCASNQSQLKAIKEFGPLEPELKEWQKAIDLQKKPEELAIWIGYRQFVHKHCLASINNDTLLKIKSKNPNNQYIPERSSEKLLVIRNLKQIPGDSQCIRCEAYFLEKSLGYVFSYQGKSHYVHTDCYQMMLDYQAAEKKKSTDL